MRRRDVVSGSIGAIATIVAGAIFSSPPLLAQEGAGFVKLDNPEYLMWKDFKPGSFVEIKSTHVASGKGSGAVVITEQTAVKKVLENTKDEVMLEIKMSKEEERTGQANYVGVDASFSDLSPWKEKKPESTGKRRIRAKVTVTATFARSSKLDLFKTDGETDTVDVAGKKIKCVLYGESVTLPDPQSYLGLYGGDEEFFTEWRSQGVPGHIAKKEMQRYPQDPDEIGMPSGMLRQVVTKFEKK